MWLSSNRPDFHRPSRRDFRVICDCQRHAIRERTLRRRTIRGIRIIGGHLQRRAWIQRRQAVTRARQGLRQQRGRGAEQQDQQDAMRIHGGSHSTSAKAYTGGLPEDKVAELSESEARRLVEEFWTRDAGGGHGGT